MASAGFRQSGEAMIRLLFLALLFFLGYTLVTAVLRIFSGRDRQLPPEKTRQGEEMVRDPQCGTYLPRGDAMTAVIRGKKHYFCSRDCRRRFEEKPAGDDR